MKWLFFIFITLVSVGFIWAVFDDKCKTLADNIRKTQTNIIKWIKSLFNKN